MEVVLFYHPRCSTCKKAISFLDEHNINYEKRDILKDNPNIEELKLWFSKIDKPIKTMFNTSGNKYKELNLKDKLNTMTNDDMLKLLSSDGMLVKRPILLINNQVLFGFKPLEWEEVIKYCFD